MHSVMQLAYEEAQKGMREKKGGPFGAAIVKDGEVIAVASNEVLLRRDPTAHAEIMAIRKACEKLNTYDLSGCELYATGEPCPMCLAAIVWANIAKVYYSNTAKEAEKIGFRDQMIYDGFLGKAKVWEIAHIDQGECVSLYEEYAKERKEIY